MSKDDHISDAARLPGGPAPISPQELPEDVASPEELPPTGPAVVTAAVKAIGGDPEVEGMVDAVGKTRVDVLTCHNAPVPGWTTWSTVTLHTQPNELPMASGESLEIRAELMAVGLPDSDVMGKVLGSCAFAVLQDHWMMAPGVVFGDVVSLYDPQTTTPHIVWCHPFTATELGAVDIEDDLTVHWLVAMPITEAERQWLEAHDYDAFANLLDEHEVTYSDLRRKSVV
ncbi:suppressor of fused domain protein [Acidipropionibacterium jensenii]|uniref:Suppressor of fused protein (SUFU) n=2 Tax=Acidipropionibacterium jensenii TaxID=1749 RepID=A0A3S4VJQ7_9ACTN|nr:suppressor of fused domain protein [Acidipropionibacterium jensenii]AZZ41015.1 suppressor of fused protein [Acidipropionibacterium jensenii]MDN5977114.1 suppressor of fused domain protein [Acidipropionibacterium jensenii]MDN5996303.1 suppressor of fused domain protein [Acidipropionibacterium jensenii]MDN6442096.1 suppressor of fused domain protein [Acidipropionibacterium jensenii]MDN6480835.1 suppressor of fused domain protein [Acidipropionibacterium jensenii]